MNDQVELIIGREPQTFTVVAIAIPADALGVVNTLTAVMVKAMSVNSGWSLSYVFPTGPLLVSIAITLGVSQLAALYPTWRAVKTVVVESIQGE